MPIDDHLHRLLGHYTASPQWVKSVVGGAYAHIPESVRFGAGYARFKARFEAAWPDPEAIAAQLADTLQVALASVPAYRAHAGLLGRVRDDPFGVLSQLPLLDKAQLKANLGQYLSEAARPAQRLKMFTGGSTAVPMSFYLEKGVTRAREWAAVNTLAERCGTDGDGVVLALRGRTVAGAAQADGRLWMYEPIKRHLILSSDHLEPQHMPRYAEALRQWQPRWVHAYPSALYPLLAWLKSEGLSDLLGEVRGVLLTSESVFEHHLAAFKAFFECPVIVQYGHSERVLFAHTLADDPRYHFWPHYGHLELIDEAGRPVTTPGAVGELVGTSFDNAVMPFIRYRTGDYAVLGSGPNPQWPGHPVCERIEGRVQEFVVCHDQRLVSITTLGAAHFDQLDHCLRLQFEQHEPGLLILRVVPLRPLTPDQRRDLAQAVFDKTQGGCRVQVEEVASIERTARGKQRLLIQHLPIERYLGAALVAGLPR
ncbi:hypothetical protein [Ideonella sp. A 288]|uniref:hypothetical protein n=1 Tax=Ideonella sp. A 288 TaxID=1962181 RepID=UPI001303E1E4|nr:hypothetical protein [Ideonella sp. A 288]